MDSLENCPLYLYDFGVDNIMLYCEVVNSTILTDVPINFLEVNRKGASMFKDRFVFDIKALEEFDSYIVSGKVKAEMKKKVVYDVSCKITKTNKVITACCKCPSGKEPSICKHSLALLYAVENYSQKELFSAPTECLQRWHQKKPNKSEPVNFAQSNLLLNSAVAERVDYQQLQRLPITAPIFDLIGNVIDIDIIQYQKSIPLPAMAYINAEVTFPAFLKGNETIFLRDNVISTLEMSWDIERKTLKQSENTLWHAERMIRLTASNFYKVCHRIKDMSSLAEQIYLSHKRDLSNIPAIAHGREMEPKVKEILMHKFPATNFRNAGLVVNPLFPYLGASPDGFFYSSNEALIVEIKCAYNESRLTLEELSKKKPAFCLKKGIDGKFFLRQSHPYYYQVQGQMAVCNMSECLFALHYDVKCAIFTEVIKFDSDLWEEMHFKLREFYYKFYLEEIVKHV